LRAPETFYVSIMFAYWIPLPKPNNFIPLPSEFKNTR